MHNVTVIIPNHNHAQFLGRRVESVFSQTFQDFEVTCLDDASTANSDRVIAPFLEDRRIRVIRNAYCQSMEVDGSVPVFGKRLLESPLYDPLASGQPDFHLSLLGQARIGRVFWTEAKTRL